MSQRKDAGKGRRRLKDLEGKKLSVAQQDVVGGGIADGTSNTLMLGERVLPAVQYERLRWDRGSAQP
jgi:hypothetical protein